MNRTTQKELLGDILDRIKDLKEELESKEKEIDVVFSKISELGDVIYNVAQVDSWDEEQLKQDVITAIIDESPMEEVRDLLYNFQSELNSYMDEISESRREALDERYIDLEQVLEMLQHDESDESLENVLDRIFEAELMIKEMKK